MKTEEMLQEHLRPLYRSFRAMGLSEAAAFDAAVGRSPEPGDSTATGLATDQLAESFRRMGLAEETAEHAAGGRGSSFREARDAEVHQIREAVAAAEARERKAKPAKPAKRAPARHPAASKRSTVQDLRESTRRLVDADIADINAGRRPSGRLGRDDR